jgi:hypothetical protein
MRRPFGSMFAKMAAMFQFIAERWRCFRESTPGRRFQERYERTANHAGWRRWAVIGGGAALCTVGTVMLVAPGPGVLLLAVGAFLLAEQSPTCARVLDRMELRLRKLLRR